MSMKNYLTQDDIQSSMRDGRLRQILDSYSDDVTPESIFESASKEAGGLLVDHLMHYQIMEEFEKTGDDRSTSVIFHMKNIVIYILYDRIPDDDVPAKVIKNYNDTMETLGEISKGKLNINLPKALIDIDGDGEGDVPKTKFRWGGEPPRRLS